MMILTQTLARKFWSKKSLGNIDMMTFIMYWTLALTSREVAASWSGVKARRARRRRPARLRWSSNSGSGSGSIKFVTGPICGQKKKKITYKIHSEDEKSNEHKLLLKFWYINSGFFKHYFVTDNIGPLN